MARRYEIARTTFDQNDRNGWAANLEIGFTSFRRFTYNKRRLETRKVQPNTRRMGQYKVQKFKETLKAMEPGLAMFIVHSSDVTDEFKQISGSGGSRYADMLSMMSPELKAYIQSEGIILTTWREALERRKKVK